MSYRSYSLDEPCGNTCPSIDNIIASIDHAINVLGNVLDRCEQPGLDNEINDAIDHLTGLEVELEGLRSNNSDLREWGKSLANVVDNIRDIL